MNYSRLSLNERINIEVGIQLNKSVRTIAKELNRSPSTISRELKRVENKNHYTATKANTLIYKLERDARLIRNSL